MKTHAPSTRVDIWGIPVPLCESYTIAPKISDNPTCKRCRKMLGLDAKESEEK